MSGSMAWNEQEKEGKAGTDQNKGGSRWKSHWPTKNVLERSDLKDSRFVKIIKYILKRVLLGKSPACCLVTIHIWDGRN